MTREDAINRLTNTLQEMRAFFFDSKHISEDDEKDLASMEMAIKALEQEPKTGHWIKTGYVDKVKCSICRRKMWNYWEVNDFNYCPNCGARMEGGAENDD